MSQNKCPLIMPLSEADIYSRTTFRLGCCFLEKYPQNLFTYPNDWSLYGQPFHSETSRDELCTRSGHINIVTMLSHCGAHLDLAPGLLADMLVGGAGAGRHQTVHCLLVAGADPNCSLISNGNTSLHAATEGGQLEIARLLLDFNADKKICNIYGLTPEDIAHTFGRLSFLDLFSDYKSKLISS